MDKNNAHSIFLSFFNMCSEHKTCKECEFNTILLGKETCVLKYCSLSIIAKTLKEHLKQVEQKASVPLENVGTIIVRGRGPSAPDVSDALLTSISRNLFAEGKEKLEPSSTTTKHDNVNSPKHYCKGGLECLTAIRAQLGKERFIGYLYGNVIKYMWRWQDKNGLEDLQKAAKYLEWLQEEVKK